MRASLVWVVGAALVVCAGVVTAVTPDADAQNDAFLVHGALGQPVHSRVLVARVDDASFADRVTTKDETWQAEGNWLVVELTVAARETEVDAAVRLVTLVVDGREFIASERPATSLVGADLRVGMGTSGMLAFEVPSGLAGDAELRLSAPHSTPHLDDVIVVPLDLDAIPRQSTVDIVEPRIGDAP